MCARLEHSWHTQVLVTKRNCWTGTLGVNIAAKRLASARRSTEWFFHDCENSQLARIRHSRLVPPPPTSIRRSRHHHFWPSDRAAPPAFAGRRTVRRASHNRPSLLLPYLYSFLDLLAENRRRSYRPKGGRWLMEGVMRSARTSSEDGRRPTGYGHFVRRRWNTH
jgi:hypothetical protein